MGLGKWEKFTFLFEMAPHDAESSGLLCLVEIFHHSEVTIRSKEV